jgi:hypothetical protein
MTAAAKEEMPAVPFAPPTVRDGEGIVFLAAGVDVAGGWATLTGEYNSVGALLSAGLDQELIRGAMIPNRTSNRAITFMLMVLAAGLVLEAQGIAQYTLPPPPPTPPSTCYGCSSGGGGSSGPTEYQQRARALNESIDRANELRHQAWQAQRDKDYQEALRLYLEAQEEYNGKYVGSEIAEAQGDIALASGDKPTALAFYEESERICRSCWRRGVRKNWISNLKKELADELEAEKQSQDNKNAASKIKGIVDSLPSASAPAATTTSLGFDDFGGTATGTTTNGAFGSNVATPKLVGGAAGPSKVGSNTNAGDQLISAGATAKHSDDLTINYDKGTALSAGSLVFPKNGSVDLSTFSESARKDPQVLSTVKELDALQIKRSQLERERDELTKRRNEAPDKAAMKKISDQVEQKAREYQDNLAVISEKTQDLEKRHREIDAQVAPPNAK